MEGSGLSLPEIPSRSRGLGRVGGVALGIDRVHPGAGGGLVRGRRPDRRLDRGGAPGHGAPLRRRDPDVLRDAPPAQRAGLAVEEADRSAARSISTAGPGDALARLRRARALFLLEVLLEEAERVP